MMVKIQLTSIEHNPHCSMLFRRHMAIQHIAIIGAGQMGNGIAQVSACAGYKVTMIDIKEEFVEKGMSTI